MQLSNTALRLIRIKLNLSQETMADLMQINQATYNRLESGKIKLGLGHVEKIAQALNVSEQEVFSLLIEWH
ncbi:helix-turn-helix transcriptional regulator [Marinilongibacter aquaticus]|uniref:helix-turn-helix transcriptional regulator n=1 Tax=Marinilongibacter aquaticus TaxID=2975157 RepID=UPI0021BD2C13|nr:helix-turn-helix transcriptional regulator [Marinilongibacter aquaticus]UBM60403.1 helix-turn-helix transcriptional regulator [Marinilongibacter aquaticus]